ncbi:MAG: T9SS type A sorting domain-containing protein [Chitinophagaceae bacterium]
MKKYLFIILFLCSYAGIKAQLYVQSGATLHVGGVVTLQNQDFIRSSPSGSAIAFEPGSKVLFTGNADNIISGYIDFLNLEIAKAGNHQVSLQGYNDAVRGQMIFTSGFFNLNNNMLLLGNTGILINENENSRIIGPAGGAVQARLQLDQPAGINPGNIGAAITSTQNLGEVAINRGYVYTSPLPSNSIQRYYSINFTDPVNDANLNATLRLHYFDAERNGTDETKLVHWKYDDASSTWLQQGPLANITRNADENWVQLTGIGSLSTWTLAESSGVLPLEFSRFNVSCENNAAVINWQTATEINTDHFNVQRSLNGTDWMTIATLNAAGQSSSLLNYSYTDPVPASSDRIFYRIQSVDIDGSKSYTPVRLSTCGSGILWQVWPNPVHQLAYISLKLDGTYKASVRLFDNKGAMVRQWQKGLVRGNNQFSVDMQGLPAGTYHLFITWNEGRGQKSATILKQ